MILLIIILSISIILAIVGKLTHKDNTWDNGSSDVSYMFSIVFAIVFILAASILIPAGRYNSEHNIRQINTLKQTLETQRKQGLELENAAVISEIIETNQYINEEKRDNSKWYWDWFIVDEIDTVQLVK